MLVTPGGRGRKPAGSQEARLDKDERNKTKNEQSVVEESKGGQLSAGDNSQAEHVTEEVVEKKDQQLNEKEEGGGNEPQQ